MTTIIKAINREMYKLAINKVANFLNRNSNKLDISVASKTIGIIFDKTADKVVVDIVKVLTKLQQK